MKYDDDTQGLNDDKRVNAKEGLIEESRLREEILEKKRKILMLQKKKIALMSRFKPTLILSFLCQFKTNIKNPHFKNQHQTSVFIFSNQHHKQYFF